MQTGDMHCAFISDSWICRYEYEVLTLNAMGTAKDPGGLEGRKAIMKPATLLLVLRPGKRAAPVTEEGSPAAIVYKYWDWGVAWLTRDILTVLVTLLYHT